MENNAAKFAARYITHGDVVNQSYAIPGTFTTAREAAIACWADLSIDDTVVIYDAETDPTEIDYDSYVDVDLSKAAEQITLKSGMWFVNADGNEDFNEDFLWWDDDPDQPLDPDTGKPIDWEDLLGK